MLKIILSHGKGHIHSRKMGHRLTSIVMGRHWPHEKSAQESKEKDNHCGSLAQVTRTVTTLADTNVNG